VQLKAVGLNVLIYSPSVSSGDEIRIYKAAGTALETPSTI